MLFGPILRLWLTGSPMRDDWSRDFALAFSVVLWLCCDVLRLIVMLNWLLFCIMRFHIKRKSSRVVSSGCSVPSCDSFGRQRNRGCSADGEVGVPCTSVSRGGDVIGWRIAAGARRMRVLTRVRHWLFTPCWQCVRQTAAQRARKIAR